MEGLLGSVLVLGLILFQRNVKQGAKSMDANASVYIPHAFRFFQGFSVIDIKKSIASKEIL